MIHLVNHNDEKHNDVELFLPHALTNQAEMIKNFILGVGEMLNG